MIGKLLKMVMVVLGMCGALAGGSSAGRVNGSGDSDSVRVETADSAPDRVNNGYRGPLRNSMPMNKSVSIFGVTASGRCNRNYQNT